MCMQILRIGDMLTKKMHIPAKIYVPRAHFVLLKYLKQRATMTISQKIISGFNIELIMCFNYV